MRTITAYGEFGDFPIGSRAIGMGSAYVAVADGPEALFFNPAGLSKSKRTMFAFYISHPYGLHELTSEAFSSIIQTRFCQLGATIRTFGSTLYRENTFAVGFGRRVFNRIHMGILIHIVHIQIARYGSDMIWMIEGGSLFEVTDRLTWALCIKNMNQAVIGEQKEHIPWIMRLGISYHLIHHTLLTLEMDKEPRFPLDLKGGLEISPISTLRIRCGFGSNPSTVSAGIGLVWNIFSLDYGLSIHPVLGASHHGSISIDLKTES
ncbi:hypothetical protein JW824_15090 [bacterium]|nr:hypothetical protein [bacterium]